MKKPWSITTTLRNPERLRDFLVILQELQNLAWTTENQIKYQILLIQHRLYGFNNAQFYKGLSEKQIQLINDLEQEISFKQAQEIFEAKNYEDPPMRGRQSINPLVKMGFVTTIEGKVTITNVGRLLLKDDFDFEEIFFRSFLKWQIPSPISKDYQSDIYNIKPFVAILHLINIVNRKEIKLGNDPKGISQEEFSIFGLTLLHYKNIDNHAQHIIDIRQKLKGKTQQEKSNLFNLDAKNFIGDFLNGDKPSDVDQLFKNLKDYSDNAIRYFRLTKYIYIRGGGFYVDLEPRRSIEISALLKSDNAQSKLFESKNQYVDYLTDIKQPILSWETKEKYQEIIQITLQGIKKYEENLSVNIDERLEAKLVNALDIDELRQYNQILRKYRQSLQYQESYQKSSQVTEIESYINKLEDIYNLQDRSIMLEKFSSLGLQALNDALNIKANHPVGDDNEPTFTAPANIPDIECFYRDFNAICEVTMLTNRDQWYNEGQPVMRHLRDFEDKNNDKDSYCLFIAPRFHRDTINTFWIAVKHGYEGRKQKIIPLTIQDFINILKILIQFKKQGKILQQKDFLKLYSLVVDFSENTNNSNEWVQKIPYIINSWRDILA